MPLPQEQRERISAEFDKAFTYSHVGDSGIGGNTPQEPVYELIDSNPQPIKDFIFSQITSAVNSYKEGLKVEIKKMMVDCPTKITMDIKDEKIFELGEKFARNYTLSDIKSLIETEQ